MTYFAEYPVFIVGYSLGDSNVTEILCDLGEAIRDKGGLLDNVYYVEWVPKISDLPHLREEHAIAANRGLPPLRVRTIVTSEFDWIFQALADLASPVAVNTKVLRHLAARVIDLVRVDVPRNKVDLDYAKIEGLTDNAEELAMVLRIGNVSNPNMGFPYILMQVGNQLGYPYWHQANILLKKASAQVAFDIKASDNKYHLAFKSGTKALTHKYSEDLVLLLRGIQAGSKRALETEMESGTQP